MTDNKVALITAAGKGMGAACARELHHSGYRLVLMSPSENVVKLAHELGAVYLQGSVTDLSALQCLVELAMSEYGRIDGVVNNTGHAAKGDLLKLTDQQWAEGFELLFLNVVRMSRLVVPIMSTQGGGSIVNISTFGAIEPSLDFPISSAIRAGLAGYVKMFSQQYGPMDIRMNNVLPGYIDSYEVNSSMVDNIPLQRPGKTAEIAKTVKFLLSEDSGYISGQSITVDGGLTKSI